MLRAFCHLHSVRSALTIPMIALAIATTTGCAARGAKGGDATVEDQDKRAYAALEQQSNRIKELETENAGLRNRLADRSAGQGTIGEDFDSVPEGFTKDKRGVASMSDDFAFAKGSADLNSNAKKSIASLAEQIKMKTGRVIIEGHTDDTPVSRPSTKEKFGDNWGLSAARASAVARVLADHGIAAERLYPIGRGSSVPLGGDKAKNRRVEISVMP